MWTRRVVAKFLGFNSSRIRYLTKTKRLFGERGEDGLYRYSTDAVVQYLIASCEEIMTEEAYHELFERTYERLCECHKSTPEYPRNLGHVVTVSLSEELKDALAGAAADAGVSVSAMAREALEAYLDCGPTP